MASLQGLPPLPKSLSGLLNFSSTQWKEMERIHAMRTMIQQDLNRSQMYNQAVSAEMSEVVDSGQGRSPPASSKGRKTSTSLDNQLAVLRKEMVGLRQLDMSLLCQLWSLNESLLEYKRLLQDRLIHSMTFQSPRWDASLDQSSCDEPDSPGPYGNSIQDFESRRRRRSFCMVHEDLSLSSSTSHSSLEFGDI